jgi:phage baseplate assembly protein W
MIDKFIGYSTVNSKSSNVLVNAELVKQNLTNAFNTRLGERIMEPHLGSRIWSLIMEPLDIITIDAIREDAERIIRQEPRVTLVSIDILEQSHGIILDIILNYMNISTEKLYLSFETPIEGN